MELVSICAGCYDSRNIIWKSLESDSAAADACLLGLAAWVCFCLLAIWLAAWLAPCLLRCLAAAILGRFLDCVLACLLA